MGVEAIWKEIKKICNVLMRLGACIAALCHFIATALGEENMKRLRDDSGMPHAFIRKPKPTKEMYDRVQAVHRLTLSCCLVIESTKSQAQYAFNDVMVEVMECGATMAPLHLKVEAYHLHRAQTGDGMPLRLSDVKTVLMPRKRLFKRLDPDGEHEFNAPKMRALIAPHAEQYKRIVLEDKLPPGMDVKGALDVYKNFKLLRAKADWGAVPMACSCKTSFGHAICEDTLLFVSLFDPEVHVPKHWVGATVSERKQCKKIGGLAGRRKMRAIEERNNDEKVVGSKSLLLAETAPAPSPRAAPAERAVPTRRSIVVPEPRDLSPSDDDDDFEVAFRFSVWCHDTDYLRGVCRSRLQHCSDRGRVGRRQRVPAPSCAPLHPPPPGPPPVSRPPGAHQDTGRRAGGPPRSRLQGADRRKR